VAGKHGRLEKISPNEDLLELDVPIARVATAAA